MPDQTPVTDDDRKAHEWASSPARQSNGLLAPVTRAILAHVPAPPATLADELRGTVQDLSQVVGLGTFDGLEEAITDIADRVEAIEKENRDMERELNNARDERDEAQHELDEAQADLRDVRNLLDQLSLGLSG